MENIELGDRIPTEVALDLLHDLNTAWQKKFHEQELILHRLNKELKSK